MIIKIRIRRKYMQSIAMQIGAPNATPRELFDLALEIGLRTLTAAAQGKAGQA